MTDPLANDVAAIARIDAVQKILEVVCQTTGLGFAAVARVTESRWVACAVRDLISFGLQPGGELKVDTTICHEIRANNELVAIDHVAQDAAFCDHPTPRMYGFQSYISVPIVLPDGQFFGTLCAIDPKPANVKRPEIIEMFKLFADLIAMHLDTHRRFADSQEALLHAQEASQLREQFIAVLGHDLRNPLAAIKSSVDVLRLLEPNEETIEILDVMKRSTSRMAGLIDDVLDFARGRLGSGLSIRRKIDPALPAVLEQVVTELQTAWPDRTIRRDLLIPHPVACDSARIGQMLSNLLANALTHGDPNGDIHVRAKSDAAGFELSVTNPGPAIPAPILKRLFHPFARGTVRPGQEGLGLGLYIASEIARAHEGTLDVSSTLAQTRFTFRMPAQPRPE